MKGARLKDRQESPAQWGMVGGYLVRIEGRRRGWRVPADVLFLVVLALVLVAGLVAPR